MASNFISLSETLAALAQRAGMITPPEQLGDSTGDARRLLRWLNNLPSADQDAELWLQAGTPMTQESKIETLAELLVLYVTQYDNARVKNPAVANDEAVLDASEAISALALSVIEHTLDMLPDSDPTIERLEALIPSLPRRASLRQAQSVQRLLSLVDAGLARISGTMRPQLPIDRLAEMSQRMQNTTRQLRSIDTLETPAREESIELAREILRRLKNMQFSDKTLESLIDAGRPEDKAALAEKLEEMVDIYKNMLFEAAQVTPGILTDPRIQEANDTANCFSHAVALMAAKEMPDSIAAAQQISAEAARAPEQWKHLAGHTVDRLMKTMEAAVEQAVQVIEQQQQQDQRNHELAQEAADLAAQQQKQQPGHRRRRRRGAAGGGLTKAAKRRNTADLNGDGIADSLQGLNLRASDMIAVRQLGTNLRDLSRQAAGSSKEQKPATTVMGPPAKETKNKPNDKDKGFAGRKNDERDRDKRDKFNPRNQGPRV